MAGPWEQYQTQPTAPEAGPWTAYAGEHGYASAPPEPTQVETTGRWAAPVGGEFGDLSAQPWAQAGPPPAPSADPSAPPPGDTQLRTDQYARERALEESANKSGYFALEPSEPGFAHLLWSLGAPFARVGQTALGERPFPTGVGALETASPLAGVGELRFSPRVSPMMKTFNEETAAREASKQQGPPPPPPERFGPPQPPDPVVESGIARVRGQIGDSQPPPPSPIPAEGVPPGVPPGTEVPTDLRLRAAIDAAGSPRPGFVPRTNVDPLTRQVTPVRVPPGAAGPETVPYAPPPDVPPVTTPPPVDPPGPGTGPRSAGAAGTPFADAALTPEQTAAAGSAADKQWYYQTAVPGEADNTVYLKGITPTMAQREQTVNAARDSKLLRRISPDAEQAQRELLTEHTNIRKGEIQEIAGSDVTHEAEMKAANDQIDAQLNAAYAHGGTVDLQPVVEAAMKEMNAEESSAGKLPPLKAAMKEIIDAAQKSDGSGLETSPLAANAVRRAIIYMQSKLGQRGGNEGYADPSVMAAMTRVKDVLTKQVEPAAPGFTEANANYARARQATDAREALQAYEPKLYNQLGHMQYSAFHRMMGEIIAARDPNAPLGPWKSLTEEQMNRLKSVHDDLKRAASAEDLARASGSDTTQTLFDLARRAARHGVGSGVGAAVGFGVGHILGPEAGMAAGMFTKDAVTHLFEKGAVDRATAEHNKLLRPDPAQYPTRPNPLFNQDAH